MNILAIDTTTNRLCLGLQAQDKFYEYSLNTGRQLSALLVPSIGRVLEAAALELEDIDYFACGLGPGSFTGMRIGLATVKGLSVVKNKPVVGVCSLDILAGNTTEKGQLIVPVVDAKRSLVYCCAYKNESGRLKRKSKYLLISPQELAEKFNSGALLLGDGAGLYAELFLSRMKNSRILDKDYWGLRAHSLMKLALDKIRAGELSSPLEIKPIYLYPKECQIKTR